MPVKPSSKGTPLDPSFVSGGFNFLECPGHELITGVVGTMVQKATQIRSRDQCPGPVVTAGFGGSSSEMVAVPDSCISTAVLHRMSLMMHPLWPTRHSPGV
jgi:hypothetical protein